MTESAVEPEDRDQLAAVSSAVSDEQLVYWATDEMP
jgi:hypothetical protein